MAKSKDSNETTILKKWHLKLAILSGIVIPTATATGSYWKLRLNQTTETAQVNERISKVELQAEKSFVDKESFQNLDQRSRRMENDITEIKTILKTKLK
jgi:hypothetical protein